MRLLVVEDNDINRDILLRMLENAGCEVMSAATARDAVSLVAGGDVDAVLMDLHMPEIDGFDAIRMIRSLAGRPARTPVIALTADTEEAVRGRAMAAGADGFLTKPFDGRDMAVALGRLAIRSQPADGSGTVRADVPADSGDPTLVPLLDRRQIRQLADRVGPVRLADLHARLQVRIRSDLAQMRAAVDAGSVDSIGVLAHRAKGSCGMMGWRRCQAVLERLQRLEGGARQAPLLLAALAQALDDTQQVLGG